MVAADARRGARRRCAATTSSPSAIVALARPRRGGATSAREARTACRATRDRARRRRRRSCRCRRPGRRTRRRTACGRGRRRPSSPASACADALAAADERRAPWRRRSRTPARPVNSVAPMLVEQLAVQLERRAPPLAARGLVRLLGPRALLLPSRASKPSRSTARPRSSAISRVRSIGKPSVSCRKNASSPGDVAVARATLVEQVEPALAASGGSAPPRGRRRCATSSCCVDELRVRAAHDVDRRVDERGRDEVARRRAGTRGAPRGG